MKLKSKAIKGIILTAGTLILASCYIGTLVIVAKAGIENVYINVIATIVFIAIYFGMFITVKKYRKGFFKENKNNIINILYLTIPFLIAILAYFLTQNVFIVMISFIIAQIMYTIYYKNYFPVPGYNKAYKYYRNNDTANAKVILNSILEKHPESFETLVLLGIIQKSNKEYTKAIEYFKKAGSIRPHDIKSLINQADCYIYLEDFDKAIEISEKSIELDPENYSLYYSIALSYYLKKDFKNAVKYFKMVSKLNVHPLQLFLVHYGLAESLLKINEIDEAASEFKKSKAYAYKSSTNFWKKQLELSPNKSSLVNNFIRQALDFVEKEKA